MQTTGELHEATIFEFAKAARYADMVVALSLLCGAPLKLVENLLQSGHREAILIPCKAAGLEWPTVRMVLNCRSIGRTSDHDIESARADYAKLSQSSAARVMRFWQIRQAASGQVATAASSSVGVPQESRSLLPAHG
jgi:hypothetical protein